MQLNVITFSRLGPKFHSYFTDVIREKLESSTTQCMLIIWLFKATLFTKADVWLTLVISGFLKWAQFERSYDSKWYTKLFFRNLDLAWKMYHEPSWEAEKTDITSGVGWLCYKTKATSTRHEGITHLALQERDHEK